MPSRSDTKISTTLMSCAVTGEKRIGERERGYAWASASPLNRMELGEAEAAAHERYKRLVARPQGFDELWVEFFVESHSWAPREVWLELNASDDPLHGHQEGRFFHDDYRCYCYLPLYIFLGRLKRPIKSTYWHRSLILKITNPRCIILDLSQTIYRSGRV